MRIIIALFMFLQLQAAEVAVLEVPAVYRGLYTISHMYVGDTSVGRIGWQHLQRLDVPMQLRINSTNMQIPGAVLAFRRIVQTDNGMRGEDIDGFAMFGTWRVDPSYNILILVNSQSGEVTAALYR